MVKRQEYFTKSLLIGFLDLQVRKQVLVERVTVNISTLKIQFNRNILEAYLK